MKNKKTIESICKEAMEIFMPDPEWDKENRQEINRRILKVLELAVESYPSMRFGQLLSCFGLEGNYISFNIESLATWGKMRDSSTFSSLSLEAEEYLKDPTIELSFKYRNYKGKESWRKVIPKYLRHGSSSWHKEPQWLLKAHDIEKDAEREFAVKDILEWSK